MLSLLPATFELPGHHRNESLWEGFLAEAGFSLDLEAPVEWQPQTHQCIQSGTFPTCALATPPPAPDTGLDTCQRSVLLWVRG